MRRFALICLLICPLLLFGCMTSISEDLSLDELPGVYPDQSAEEIIETTLYYPLEESGYIVPVDTRVSVQLNEAPEWAVMRTLLSGAQGLSYNLLSPFPSNIEVVSMSANSDVLRISFNNELLSLRQNALAGQSRDVKTSVYCAVNSLLELGNYERVEIRVVLHEGGEGVRVAPSMLGFDSDEEWLSPLEYAPDVVADVQIVASIGLAHLVEQSHYDAAAYFYLPNDINGSDIAIDAEFLMLPTIVDFAVHSFERTETGDVFTRISLTYLSEETGLAVQTEQFDLPMELVDGLYKMNLSYLSGKLR